MVWVNSLELFATNTRSFQVNDFFSKKFFALLEEARFISANWDNRFGLKK